MCGIFRRFRRVGCEAVRAKYPLSVASAVSGDGQPQAFGIKQHAARDRFRDLDAIDTG